jgi:hypothetical protein
LKFNVIQIEAEGKLPFLIGFSGGEVSEAQEGRLEKLAEERGGKIVASELGQSPRMTTMFGRGDRPCIVRVPATDTTDVSEVLIFVDKDGKSVPSSYRRAGRVWLSTMRAQDYNYALAWLAYNKGLVLPWEPGKTEGSATGVVEVLGNPAERLVG